MNQCPRDQDNDANPGVIDTRRQQAQGETLKNHHRKRPPRNASAGAPVATTTTTKLRKDPPVTSSVEQRVTAITPDPVIIPTATTTTATTSATRAATTVSAASSSQEAADRQLAEAIHAEEVALSQQQQRPQDANDGSLTRQDREEDKNLREVYLMESTFLPVLELVWPEVYWLRDGDTKALLVRTGNGEEASLCAYAVQSTTTSTTVDGDPSSLPDDVVHKGRLYRALVEQAVLADTTPDRLRAEIRTYGPLTLLGRFRNESSCFQTLEDLSVFASTFDCDDDDDGFDSSAWHATWKSWTVWDSPRRIQAFESLCGSIEFLGEEDFCDTAYMAKTCGFTPPEIIDYIQHRCQEEVDEAFRYVNAKLPATSTPTITSTTTAAAAATSKPDATFEEDLQTAMALSLVGEDDVVPDESSRGEKRKSAARSAGEGSPPDVKMGAVRNQVKQHRHDRG